MADKYKKSKGNAGLEGIQFQLNLLTVSLLNALHNRRNWKISTENPEAAKYDDIVIELPEKSAVLIQSKHKDNRKVTKDQLFSHNSKNADFSLPKYFFSYQEIKSKFKEKTVIICTNTDVNKKGLENVMISQPVDSDSILHCETHSCSYFTFSENILSDLKVNAEIYYDKNLQGKGIDKTTITDENLKDFLKNLQFFSNYPNGPKLDEIIKQLLFRLKSSTLYRKTTSQEIYKKLEDWFKQRKGEYLTEIRAKAMFCDIKSDKYCEILEDYEMSFDVNNFSFADPKRIFRINTKGGYLLQMLKIYRALQDDKSKKLFVNPDDSAEVKRQMIETFELHHYTFLIMTWSKLAEQSSIKLRQILEKDQYKKVILVSESDNKLCQQIGLEVVQLDGCVTFESISKNSQENLLRNKNVIFQGETISLEKLLGAKTLKNYTKYLDSQILEKLVNGEGIKVGERPLDMNDDIARYYTSRIFERDEKNDRKREYIFSEEGIYDINEKVVLIADGAGTGKSTVLTKLAVAIKKKNPDFWVIKINLNEYTGFLRDSVRKKKKTVNVIELLNFKETTKLTNGFEEFVFSINKKIVFMLDGVDEISPDYTDLVLNLLVQCQKAPNFAKIFITTRPHLSQKLEKILNIVSFKMAPFTSQNQTDFLTSYWIHNLKLDDTNEKKCKRYAEALLDKMSSCIESCHYWENSITAIPLQVKMVAEIFQENIKWHEPMDWEGCREYLNGDNPEPKLPNKINIAELYDMFIENKRNVFVDKGSGNTAADKALVEKFAEYLEYHRSLALDVILDKTERGLFLNCHPSRKDVESYVLKMGIVQKLGSELQFQHMTFAEHYLAKSILRELEEQNSNVDFQRFLMDEIFLKPEFNIVRTFLDNILRNVVLPSNIFENYQSSLYSSSLNYRIPDKNIIFVLAQEGCVEILRLILKSFKFSRCAEINDTKKIKKKTDILEDLEVIMLNFDIKDENGYMSLHYAVIEGHLEMVKFLIDQGANVNSTSDDGHTALHLAARSGNLDIVKYLLELGVDVNCEQELGRTALHLAAEMGNLDTVKYLIVCGADVNSRSNDGYMALNLAAQTGNWDTVKYLTEHVEDVNSKDNSGRTALHSVARVGILDLVRYLVEHGGDVNSKDSDDHTVLHSATRSGNLDTVKYLVERGANIKSRTSDGFTVLHLAILFGNLETVRYLVERGVDINNGNTYGCTILYLAAYSNNLDFIKYLVECGADVNSRSNAGGTVLHSVAESDNFEAVKYLVENGADINSRDSYGRTILHLVADSVTTDIVKYLVERGADINSRDSDGYTILHSVARSKYLMDDDLCSEGIWKTRQYVNFDTIKYLVQCGADVNSKCNYGRTLLHLVVEATNSGNYRSKNSSRNLQGEPKFNLDDTEYLVQRGVDINNKDSHDLMALHSTAGSDNLNAVKYIVECGANINSKDNDGCTVLHLATKSNNLDVVRYFVELGANINSKDSTGQTVLHSAVGLGNLNVVKYLTERGADINSKDNDGRTLLHAATKSGSLDVVKCLVECGADINARDNGGCTVLHLATESGNLNLIKYFVERGVDINSRDSGNSSILHLAVKSSDLGIIKFVVKCGAEVNSRDNHGHTALHLAAKSNDWNIVKYFLEHGADINCRDSNGRTVLYSAIRSADLSTVKYLVEHGANINNKDSLGYTVLHSAIQSGNLDTVKCLAECGSNINCNNNDGHAILHSAIESDNLNIIIYLIEIGLDINIKDRLGDTLLHLAAKSCNLDTVKYLLKNDADINSENRGGYTALDLAAQMGNWNIVKCLVEQGADINHVDSSGSTVLQSACRSGNLDAVKYLMKFGADINNRDRCSNTALHSATRSGNLDTVKYLVKSGANIKVRDSGGCTVLHAAAASNQLHILTYFVELGLNVNGRDYLGYTVLHLAAKFGNLDIVKYLAECGADVNSRNTGGRTVLHSAVVSGNLDIIEYLVGFGLDINSRDRQGCSVLYLAAQSGNWKAVKYLVENGGYVNGTGTLGRTVLHMAAWFENMDIIIYLMERGVNINVRDDDGNTPQQLAPNWININIKKRLKDFGVDINTMDSDNYWNMWYTLLQKKKESESNDNLN